ncbi:MAG: polyprenyl synthetase family protein [Bacteroidales bacterium]|nr:polyprenyl synthetase family protein [Bacteroidales bacterium]
MIEQALTAIDWTTEPRNLYEPIGYTLAAGGKRIRPTLVLMACDLWNGDKKEALPAALAVEIFHNFTLLHDDLMDNADMRRGKPTVHKKWDANTAILSGDAMTIKAYEMLERIPERHLKKCLHLFTKMALEICEGQQYDIDFESRSDVSAEEYLNMIRLKTAVLLGSALKIGATLADAPEHDAELLYNFGINIGMAFQLKDDLLDVYGDPETFGKKTGGDILCNKKTFMLIAAQKQATGAVKNELEKWLSAHDYIPKEKIAAVTAIYDKLSIKAICEKKMDEYYSLALKNLAEISVDNNKKTPLKELAEKLMKRNK